MRRPARRSRRAVSPEQSAVRHRLLRDPPGRCDGRADQPDEPDQGGRSHRHRQRRDRAVRRAGPARARRAADRPRPGAGDRRLLLRLPDHADRPRRAGVDQGTARGAVRARGDDLEHRHRGGRGPGSAPGDPRRSLRDAVHLGHHRQPQGLCPSPPQRDVHGGRGIAVGPDLSGRMLAGGDAVLPRHRHAGRLERADLRGVDGRAAAALGSRRGRGADQAPPRHDHDDGPHHGGRPLVEPGPGQLRPVEPAPDRRRRRRDARGGRPEAAGPVRPRVHRGLRPHRDHGAEPRQSPRPPQEAVPRHPATSTPSRASSTRTRWPSSRPARSARSSRAVPRCSTATGTTPRPTPPASSSSTAGGSSAPATSRGSTRTATTSWSTGSSA